MQISAGYFYSNCTNIPADMISKPEPDKGIQLNPQVGFNINWNFVRLGLSLGIVLQKEIREYGDFIIDYKDKLESHICQIIDINNYFLNGIKIITLSLDDYEKNKINHNYKKINT